MRRGETHSPLFTHKDSLGLDFPYAPGVKNRFFMYLCSKQANYHIVIMNRILTLLGTLLLVALIPFISTAGGTYTLSVGQTQTLSFAARDGGKGFTWTSADPSAVEITSQSGTTATVIALRGAARPVTVACDYTVTVQGAGFSYEDPVREEFYIKIPLTVTGIEIPSALQFYKGDTYAFNPRVLPDGAVTDMTWTSSNTAVATVNNIGELRAVGEGIADITVRAATGHSATCRVTVILPTATVAASVNQKYVAKGAEIELTATPAGAGIHYTLDGSEPTANSTLYTAPIIIDNDVTLKAVACAEDYYDSEVLMREYRVSTLAVISTYPADGVEVIRPDVIPVVTFNSPNCRGAYFDDIRLVDDSGRSIPGQAAISGANLFFIPDEELPAESYRLEIPLNSVENYAGEYNQTESSEIILNAPCVKISATLDNSFVVKSDGTLWGWGANYYGQLGDATTTDRHSPFKIMDGVMSVSAGGGHRIVIKDDGSLWSWGRNGSGQLGDGTTTDRHSPVKIMDGVKSVSAGGVHSIAIKEDGSLWAWGDNIYGQLGDGTTTSSHSPVKIMDGVRSVSAGGCRSVAIKDDGSLWAWGDNGSGQLGDGTTTSSHSPVKIMDGAMSVSAGYAHSIAIKDDGSLWTWGDNYSGQLGDGTTTSRHSPVKIMDGVKSVSAVGSHSIAIKDDGSLWTWGHNLYGQLGDGTTTNRHSPVKIMDRAMTVSAGGDFEVYHSIAIKDDGSLWAWGYNYWGQLGDGTTTSRHSPVKIIDGLKSPDSFSLLDTEVGICKRAVAVPRLEPADASYKAIAWRSSDEGVVAVDGRGVLTGLADGEATVTAEITTYDDRTLSASCCVRVFESAGVASMAAASGISIEIDGLAVRVDCAARIISASGMELHRSASAPTVWTAPSAGVYIVLSSDGRSRKVLLR